MFYIFINRDTSCYVLGDALSQPPIIKRFGIFLNFFQCDCVFFVLDYSPLFIRLTFFIQEEFPERLQYIAMVIKIVQNHSTAK